MLSSLLPFAATPAQAILIRRMVASLPAEPAPPPEKIKMPRKPRPKKDRTILTPFELKVLKVVAGYGKACPWIAAKTIAIIIMAKPVVIGHCLGTLVSKGFMQSKKHGSYSLYRVLRLPAAVDYARHARPAPVYDKNPRPISPVQKKIMALLIKAGDGGLTFDRIARGLGVRKRTSQAVNILVARGFVSTVQGEPIVYLARKDAQGHTIERLQAGTRVEYRNGVRVVIGPPMPARGYGSFTSPVTVNPKGRERAHTPA